MGDVTVFGIGQYSMRIWLDPEQMLQRSLMPSDVIAAVQQQNAYVAAGQIAAPPVPAGESFQLTIDVGGNLSRAEEFEAIIVKNSGGQITRLRDVGRVELGAQTYGQFFKMNDRVAGGIAIYQLPEANALDTAARVRAKMTELARDFPEGLQYDVPFDTTVFVKESVNEVYHTLFEAGLLVLVVIVVFLQDWRATLVPATTVPVTIIGAFAAMAAMGFSVNLLTLFAVVLAIGIVVDDAIVVVEGVSQHVERGQTPKQGSIDAMKELMGPIIGITLVLMSVFLPPAFMPGITGQMYRQFALVIAATALISAVNALTLKPTQCALWLRPRDPQAKKAWFFRAFNAVYEPAGAAVRAGDPVHGGAQRADGGDGAGADRPGRLGADPRADRVHPDRGPGLRDGHRPASRRRLARADRTGDGRARADLPREPRPGAHDLDRRALAARRQRLARQRRDHLPHVQGLERAREGRGPPAHLRGPVGAASPGTRMPGRWCSFRRRSRGSGSRAASRCRSS